MERTRRIDLALMEPSELRRMIDVYRRHLRAARDVGELELVAAALEERIAEIELELELRESD